MRFLKKLFKWISVFAALLVILFLLLLIIPEKETVAKIQPRESTQYWQMSEGFRIAYTHLAATADSSKSPLIFVHGGPGGYIHSSIIETMGALAQKGYNVYLYDQRGSGLSDRLPKFSDVSFEKHLQDLHEIITEKIGAEKVILVGQSFGANIINHYAAIHPARVEKLVFSSPDIMRPPRRENGRYVDIDSLYPVPDSLNFIEPYNFVNEVNLTAAKPKSIVATLGALLLDVKLISDTQMDRMLNTLAGKFTRGMVCNPNNVFPEEGGGGLYAYLATNNNDMPDIRGEIAQVQAPVLVLQGQCEYIPFGAAWEYVELYPDAQYRMIKEAGHIIWWEQPDMYIGSIAAFLVK